MNRKKTPQSVSALLGAGAPGLAGIAARTRQLKRVERAFLELLPPPLAGHCGVANLHENTLVLHCDSAAWGSKLRYLAPTLLRQLNARLGLDLGQVNVKVMHAGTRSDTPLPPKRPAPHLGAEAARSLESCAGGVDNPRLRRALLRLARRAT